MGGVPGYVVVCVLRGSNEYAEDRVPDALVVLLHYRETPLSSWRSFRCRTEATILHVVPSTPPVMGKRSY